MKHSETLTELFKALSKAQGVIRPAFKGAKNPHLKSNYADLGSIWDACREALAENGLSVSQWPCDTDPGFMALTTVLGHGSGEYIMETYRIPMPKPDPQTAGSVLTYAKRYSLASILGIVGTDEDDDAQSAMPDTRAMAQNRPSTPQQPQTRVNPPPAQTQAPQAGLSDAAANRLHAQLGAMLTGTPYAQDHDLFASEVIKRPVNSFTELNTTEATQVYNAAQKTQQETQAA